MRQVTRTLGTTQHLEVITWRRRGRADSQGYFMSSDAIQFTGTVRVGLARAYHQVVSFILRPGNALWIHEQIDAAANS